MGGEFTEGNVTLMAQFHQAQRDQAPQAPRDEVCFMLAPVQGPAVQGPEVKINMEEDGGVDWTSPFVRLTNEAVRQRRHTDPSQSR
eukprot:5404198-Amphidinium_carterae.1